MTSLNIIESKSYLSCHSDMLSVANLSEVLTLLYPIKALSICLLLLIMSFGSKIVSFSERKNVLHYLIFILCSSGRYVIAVTNFDITEYINRELKQKKKSVKCRMLETRFMSFFKFISCNPYSANNGIPTTRGRFTKNSIFL